MKPQMLSQNCVPYVLMNLNAERPHHGQSHPMGNPYPLPHALVGQMFPNSTPGRDSGRVRRVLAIAGRTGPTFSGTGQPQTGQILPSTRVRGYFVAEFLRHAACSIAFHRSGASEGRRRPATGDSHGIRTRSSPSARRAALSFSAIAPQPVLGSAQVLDGGVSSARPGARVALLLRRLIPDSTR